MRSTICILIVLLPGSLLHLARAQDSLKQVIEAGKDTDPTKPTAFSFRNEFTKINEGAWSNLFIFRFDKLVIKRLAIPERTEGILSRIDIPVVSTSNSSGSKAGLGDVYMQALFAPRIKNNFFIGIGTGILIPTASSESLGYGKWIVAPAIVPGIIIPKKGLAYIKFQDYVSFAGNPGRKNIHFFAITPTFLRRIKKRFWVVVDSESNTNWLANGQTWFKSGLLTGYMLTHRVGIWVKGEVPYGQYRQTDWMLKASLFVTKF